MAEETVLNAEGDSLNREEAENKSTYTAEEVEALRKELASNSDRGVQKILGKQKVLETVLDEIGMVAEDPTYLVDLHERNPEVARVILQKYYDGQDIEQFKTSIDYQEDFSDPVTVKRHIEKEAERKLQIRTIEERKAQFIDRLGMDDTERKAFEEAFEERRALKSFSVDSIDKHLEKAYREIADEEQIRKLSAQETIGKSMATGNGGKAGSAGESKNDPLKSEISSFLSKYL